MSHESSPLQVGSVLGPSVEERFSSRSLETYSFADLIRAREEQQRRIREALEEQNRQLRARLGSEEANQGAGDPAITASAARHRSSQSPAKQHSVPIEEFITFVTEMKDLLNCAQQADLVALHALQDRVDFQNRDLAQRITELEAQMIAMQRRDEFGYATGDSPFAPVPSSVANMVEDKSPLQYVLHELEEVRHAAEEAAKRVREYDEVLDRHRTSFCLLEKDINVLETKMVDLEALPSLFRRESMTMEERYAEFTHRLQEEILVQRERWPRSIEGTNDAIRQLEERLKVVERAVFEMNQRSTVEIVNRGSGDVECVLPSLVGKKLQEPKKATESFPQAKLDEPDCIQSASAADDPTSSAGGGAPLLSKGQDDVTTEFLGDLPKETQCLDAKPHTVTSDLTTDAPSMKDRIEPLTKEVDCANVMLEGAIARRAYLGIDPSILGNKQMVERVTKVETQLGILEEKLNYFAGKFEVSNTESETHTGESAPKTGRCTSSDAVAEAKSNRLDISTKSHHSQERINRYLKEDLELATVGLRPEAAEQIGTACNIAATASPNGLHFMEGNMLLHSASGQTAVLPVRRRMQVSRKEPENFSFGPFKAPSVPITSGSLSKAVAEIHERKRQKEGAVKEVIAALREVQKRFSELSDRESATQRCSARRSGQKHLTSSTCDDPVSLLEFIATQKEAIYSKEKQLLDLRNTLWREIAQLEEDEREFLSLQSL
ncbi:hypothetical protein TCSYLVIO_005583 [Trypanosoma cruzi]|nr:hypothetical protein TCSYLVIO_005583 [Trypanosoma cruzi]